MNLLLALGMPGMPELLILLVIVILIFGARKLPELARGVGRSIGEFKKGREESEKLEDKSEKTADSVETKPNREG
jgi:sec-independent protein translocase protein TatA